MTSSCRTGHRFALVLAAFLAAMPLHAGNEGGWVNLPSWRGKNDIYGIGPLGQDGRSFGGRGVGILVSGKAAVSTLRQLREQSGVRIAIVPEGVRVEGGFSVALGADALANGSLNVAIGQDYIGGFGVVQAKGLPPVVFVVTSDRLEVPHGLMVQLAGGGYTEVALRFTPATMDRFTLIDLKLSVKDVGALELTSQIR